MDITKLQFILFCLWIFSLVNADVKISNYRLLIPYFEIRHAYEKYIDNYAVTIIPYVAEEFEMKKAAKV